MSNPEVQALPRVIFEDTLLYGQVSWEAAISFHRTDVPAVQLYCHTCRGYRTFSPGKRESDTDGSGNPAGVVMAIWYVCPSCRKQKYAFLLRVSEDRMFLMKIGQYPEPRIDLPPSLPALLGKDYAMFIKGLKTEKQGCGIGALDRKSVV